MNIPWFTLNDDPQDAGCVYPPHQMMRVGYNYQADCSVHRIPCDRLANFDPDFDTVTFEPTAKLHDLMASAPIPNYGWLISHRFMALLSSHGLPTHRIYRLPVVQCGRRIDGYVWLHLPQSMNNISETMSIAEAEHTIRSNSAIAELDVLPIYWPIRFSYFFISQRLRSAIEHAGLTGIRFGASKLFRV